MSYAPVFSGSQDDRGEDENFGGGARKLTQLNNMGVGVTGIARIRLGSESPACVSSTKETAGVRNAWGSCDLLAPVRRWQITDPVSAMPCALQKCSR